MSVYSKDIVGKDSVATYKQHLVYEVATNLADSKHIADDYNSAYRYQHRAFVTLVGHATIRPYDPIYLDGLPNGMSGYWTVISVKHIFGGAPADYMLRLEVGTDVIGDTDPNAKNRSDTRDIQSDLSGQSITPSNSSLSQYALSANATTIEPSYGTVPTAVTSKTAVTIPTVSGITPHTDVPPNLSGVKRTVKWTAKSSGKVIR